MTEERKSSEFSKSSFWKVPLPLFGVKSPAHCPREGYDIKEATGIPDRQHFLRFHGDAGLASAQAIFAPFLARPACPV